MEFKYLWRFERKNGIIDLHKSQWYQDKYEKLFDKLHPEKEPKTIPTYTLKELETTNKW